MMFHELMGSRSSSLMLALAWFMLLDAAPAHSQDLPSAEEIVRCFILEYSSDGGKDERCGSLSTGVTGVQTSPSRYPASLYEDVMDGLVDLAINHPDRRVRRSAAVWIVVPGTAPDQAPGTVQRMRTVFDQSDDADVRAVLVNYSPRQRETEEAMRFLVHVATGDRGRDVAPFPDEVLALDALAKIGPAGRAALIEMHQAQSLKTEAARQQLQALARMDFQSIDYRKQRQERQE